MTKTWGNRKGEKLRICNNHNEDKKQRKRLHNEIAKIIQKTMRNKISEIHNRNKSKNEILEKRVNNHKSTHKKKK